MNLDVTSIYVMICVVTLTMAFCLIAANFGKRQDEVSKWAMLMLFSGIATALLMLRGQIPNLISISGANTLLSTGYMYGYVAFCEYTNTVKRRWYIIGTPLLVALFNTIFLDQQALRMVLNSAAFGTQNLIVLGLIIRGTAIRPFTTRWIVAAGTAIGIVSYYLRATAAIIWPQNFTSLASQTVFNTITLVAISMAVVISSVGVLLLSRERSDAENLHHATYDYLTETLNRRGFLQAAQHEIARHLRSEKPLSLIMIDADNFKRVNDAFGHLCGDQVLQDLAARIKSNLRSYDILGRFGGEEFWIILPETNNCEAYTIAERIRLSIADHPIQLNDTSLKFTISCGVTTHTTASETELSLNALIHQADGALYQAKTVGRNQTVRYH